MFTNFYIIFPQKRSTGKIMQWLKKSISVLEILYVCRMRFTSQTCERILIKFIMLFFCPYLGTFVCHLVDNSKFGEKNTKFRFYQNQLQRF